MEKQKRSKVKNTKWEFPQHIVELIFSKLPFYALPRCRIVCKAWNNLVLDGAPSFKLLPNAFLINTSSFSSFGDSKFHCIDHDTIRSVASFNVHWALPHVSIINSCNGLLYISSTNEYQHNSTHVANYGILNPMTSEFLHLFELERFFYYFGFGLCPKTEQYKLFRISYVFNRRITIIEVIRFGITKEFNHLKSVESRAFGFRIEGNGVYLNGVIYWIANNIVNDQFGIYGLNVETETFETVAILDVVAPGCSEHRARLQLLNDTVYAVIQQPLPSSSKILVWSMRDKHSCVEEFVHVFDDAKLSNFYLVKAFEDRISFLVNNDLFCFHKTERKITKINTVFDLRDKRIVSVLYMQSFQFGSVQNILEGKNSFTSNE